MNQNGLLVILSMIILFYVLILLAMNIYNNELEVETYTSFCKAEGYVYLSHSSLSLTCLEVGNMTILQHNYYVGETLGFG